MTAPFAFDAPWHKASFDRFLNQRLPELLAERLPLAGYSMLSTGPHTCTVTVELAVNSHSLALEYPGLPQPDAQGLFEMAGEPYLIVPLASQEELDQASIKCAGEQLYDYIAAHLGTMAGQGAGEIAWDEAAARALLPLDAWFEDFLNSQAQRLDDTNWHSRHTHLRRLLIPNRKRVVAPGQQGRVDPFETPEGPNIGRVFTIALGARIEHERLVIFDASPAGGLGHNAALVPFLEHDDANRLLMGVNMMRQGLVPAEAEPALVQTGFEPVDAGPDLWCGRNLLTAFVAGGEGSVEDGLILSESCAQRLNYPYPAEIGDKLANRHGTKGVVSQVLPDAQMPHLADGTPVELIFSFSGLHIRGNFGQVREAVLGRIARAEGQPAIVPPFQAPSAEAIRARLVQAGLPESGMEHLRLGQAGPVMPYPSTVGYVYWYRLTHLSRSKLKVIGAEAVTETGPAGEADTAPHPFFHPWMNGQLLGETEISLLRQLGALYNASEALTTRATRANLAQGTPGLTPYFRELAARLAAAGLRAAVEGGALSVQFAPAQVEPVLRLAQALPHPWLPEKTLQQVGAPPEAAGSEAQSAFSALQRANDRLARWLETRPSLAGGSAYAESLAGQVAARLAAYLDALLPPQSLRAAERQIYSGRAVISPGVGLRLDQIGLPDEIAQALFGEQAEREQVSIDQIMEQAWVLVLRAPVVNATSLLAFHPVRVDGPALRLPPLACALLNADFDGDQVAVFRPLSAEAQREAGAVLSVSAHLARDPELAGQLVPPHEGLWGVAYLSLSEDGRRQIAESRWPTSGMGVPLTQAEIAAGLRDLARQAPQDALSLAERLARLGYAAARASGASLSPFAGAALHLPPAPHGGADQPAAHAAMLTAWEEYVELCAEEILSGRDYRDPDLGPQLLSAAARPRSRRLLPLLVGPRGAVTDASGRTVFIQHSLVEGRSAQELYASVAEARLGLAQLVEQAEQLTQPEGTGFTSAESGPYSATTLLARARRSRRPGIVFARAAASAETDPLTDVESRLLVGLPAVDLK